MNVFTVLLLTLVAGGSVYGTTNSVVSAVAAAVGAGVALAAFEARRQQR